MEIKVEDYWKKVKVTGLKRKQYLVYFGDNIKEEAFNGNGYIREYEGKIIFTARKNARHFLNVYTNLEEFKLGFDSAIYIKSYVINKQ